MEDVDPDEHEPMNIDGDDMVEEDEEKELSVWSIYLILAKLNLKHIEWLAKDWTAPIYAFFGPVPTIEYMDGRHCHSFQCTMKTCKNRTHSVQRFLDKGDAKSTSNLQKHAWKCWGEDVVKTADEARNADDVRATTVKGVLQTGSIATSFEQKGKGKVTYSHRQHTKTETRYVLRSKMAAADWRQQGRDRSLGVQKHEALQYCWRLRI